MKNYNFNNLPPVWCVDTFEERLHTRLSEFEEIYSSNETKIRGLPFAGIDKDKEWDRSNDARIFNNNLLSLDDFFALVDDLRLEEGNCLYCCGDGAFFKNGKLYEIHKSIAPRDDETIFIIDDRKAAFYLDGFTNRDNLFRNATSYEIASLKEVQPPEYINFLDWKEGDSMKCIKGYMDIKAGEECKIEDRDSDYIYFEGEFGQEQNISYSVLLKHFEKVVWMPKEGDLVLTSMDKIKWSKEPEVYVGYDTKNGYHVTEIEACYHGHFFVKPYQEKPIPYLTEIEELIKKSNAESDFSVLTLNIEKK